MKKRYIVPETKTIKFISSEFFCNIHQGYLQGIVSETGDHTPDPSGESQGTPNPLSADQYSNQRGFGSDSPWESLW